MTLELHISNLWEPSRSNLLQVFNGCTYQSLTEPTEPSKTVWYAYKPSTSTLGWGYFSLEEGLDALKDNPEYILVRVNQ